MHLNNTLENKHSLLTKRSVKKSIP